MKQIHTYRERQREGNIFKERETYIKRGRDIQRETNAERGK